MFGSPIKLTLLISLVFGLGTGSALVWLTRPNARTVKKQVVQEEVIMEGTNCWVTVRSAHPMERIRIFQDGNEMPLDRFSDTESETEIVGYEELRFKMIVKWPEGTPETALLIKIEPEGQATQEQTYWAEGKLTQELTFSLDKEELNAK